MQFILALLFSAGAYATNPAEGVYMLSGHSAPTPKSTYYGSVTITNKGKNFELKWKIGPSQTQTGIGILTKGVLSVGYFDDSGKDFGVVSYEVKSSKKLIGKWAPLGAADSGGETLEWMGEDTKQTWAKVEKAIHDKSASIWSKKLSMRELEDKLILETDRLQKFYLLSEIIRIYAAEKIDKASEAEERASDLIELSEQFKGDWNYGNAIHHGNLVLGRVKLIGGDKKGAKEFLKKAGQTPGSPQINSFGPNMMLAKELLAAGEKEAVLEYFDAVKKFWKNSEPILKDWKTAIAEGKTPNFGANLVY